MKQVPTISEIEKEIKKVTVKQHFEEGDMVGIALEDHSGQACYLENCFLIQNILFLDPSTINFSFPLSHEFHTEYDLSNPFLKANVFIVKDKKFIRLKQKDWKTLSNITAQYPNEIKYPSSFKALLSSKNSEAQRAIGTILEYAI